MNICDTWYDNKNNLIYGSPTLLDQAAYTNKIDAPTLIGLILRGYGYEDTTYYTHNSANKFSWIENPNYTWTINPYDWKNCYRTTNNIESEIRYSS